MAVDGPDLRRKLTWVGLALIVAYVAGVQLVSLIRDRGWVTAGTRQALDREGVFYLPDQRVFVVANGDRPVALSALSPHLGERLVFCRSSGWFQDVHGDTFDRYGRYVLGPAPRGMDRIAVRLVGDLVEVRPGEVTPGPAPGAEKPLAATGPHCGDNPVEGPPGFASSPAP